MRPLQSRVICASFLAALASADCRAGTVGRLHARKAPRRMRQTAESGDRLLAAGGPVSFVTILCNAK
jgi:hypothetical protein